MIGSFGEQYQKHYLYYQNDKNTLKQSLVNDWWEALKFFFGRSFMRGRRDEISTKFLERAIHVLEGSFGSDKNKIVAGLSDEWKNNLQSKLHEGGVNNRADRKMVISTLEFTFGLRDDGFNLVTYSSKKISAGEIEKPYKQLDELDYVGDKIASFFLRDVVSIFDLQVSNEHQTFLQPIDTWVGQVIEHLNICQKSGMDKAIGGNKKSLDYVRGLIVKSCNNAGVSPIEFNQGAWYIGFHSFQIVLKNLSKIRPEEE